MPTRATPRRIAPLRSIPFFFVHVLAVLGVFWVGFSWSGLALALGSYAVRMFGVTGAYHRYFSHRTYKTSRLFQFLLAFLAQTSVQKGALWWAAHHRTHHRHSDEEGDLHSALRDGLWWSHVGWILSADTHATEFDKVKDLARYPELRWLDRYHLLPPLALGLALYAAAGIWGVYWGLIASTTLLWHGTFTINSLTHVFGSRRYQTTDNSRNNLWLALITLGEGWHNNHHYYQRATNQGFFWWEIDVTFYVLKALSWVGLVWDLHTPPPHVLEGQRANARANKRTQAALPLNAVPAAVSAPLSAPPPSASA